MAEIVANKARIHTVYKKQSGERVPSVTTILGILNKPALLQWAWQLGTQGIDYKAVRDNAGDIGTLAHYLIMCYLRKETPNTSEYSQADMAKAENALIKFWDWEKINPIEPIILETPLVSEQYGYGGTLDCLAKRVGTGEIILIDFKTGKALYDEHFYQLSAYENLLAEAGYRFDKTMILRIGRDETEGFEVRDIGNLDKHFELFKACLSVYKLQGEIRRVK